MWSRATTLSQAGAVALLLATDVPAVAQVPQPGTLRVEVSVVTVGVRVTDSKGREVPNLRAADFALYEDGVVQQIAFFSSEEQPISLGILLDRSDSMGFGAKFDRAKAAAQLIADATRRGSEYLYIPFDAHWKTDAQFTEQREKIEQEITETRLGGGTSLYDAILAALERSKGAKHGRQAIIVITDGADQHSSHTLDDVIRGAQESQVQLYAIGYFSKSEEETFRRSGPRVMLSSYTLMDNPMIVFKRLARESGAEAFFPRSNKELQSAAERISRDLRTQYTLAYYPSNTARDGRYRRIKVSLRSRTGLKVRAREGYLPATGQRVSSSTIFTRPTTPPTSRTLIP